MASFTQFRDGCQLPGFAFPLFFQETDGVSAKAGLREMATCNHLRWKQEASRCSGVVHEAAALSTHGPSKGLSR